MKLFNAKQIYAADKFTIEKQNITSTQLMEQAAVQLFNWLHLRMQGAQVKIHLFCGIGNNGGDGMALARHLQEHGYNIGVYVVNYSKKRSEDFLVNLERLKDRKVWPDFLEDGSSFPEISKEDIIVDAIFGIGLNRTPDDWVVSLFDHLHRTQAFILSVDIPSGLFTDRVPERKEAVIKSNFTLSFQVPKLVFFLPDTGNYVQQWEVLDIGLDVQFLMETETDYELIGKHEVLPLYKPREKYSHKGTYGHALIIGGSFGKMGAVHLAAKACLHSGSGLVSVLVPKCGVLPLQTNLPEAMVVADDDDERITKIEVPIAPTVIGVGVGLGTDKRTAKALSDFLEGNKVPLVVDADGLNILSNTPSLLDKLPPQSVLTPHPKELERLIGPWKDDFEKLEKAKGFSKKYDCILVIKGHHTLTVYNGRGYVNTTGNPGMATGGSGDVLTGVITGLMAQGYEPLYAAVFGVYLHGRAGDIMVEGKGYQALLASDVSEGIGQAFMDLFAVERREAGEDQEEGR
ncbi:bifunctional ADP-dependent NAD(P)H-hydrate dehydratase/NAD(P)H-hydrate epimerase [Pseudozobellia thermophila]|uniref:Bifunctional NAD(P)H-hydrate repair enzyme n=1 Tax=Pseudozobellia thermophila TaxID=192903 RepID=A0A1M6GPQ6_9FLAO|nr:bifunctional ADP-dependent NAD(P)H-hydrate dehydratase/NAD(P)H-hydrate epimerase [Pseudozobellia thermophila]SHJ11957.1 yjeF C-terminal region, hydroxyethylthiazole kinase-related/yjeF N-terminal region [Pseudozobellia thermophila]